jgi:hypothetical protein
MANEVIEVKAEPASSLAVRLTGQSIQEMTEQRRLFKEFVAQQLVQDVDYGIIPGCPKPSLYKPGAEKFQNIFKLGSRIIKQAKALDLDAGFAMFEYTIEVYDLRSGIAIGQCEGSCNSMENKYRNVPFGNVLNTLQKMAQKRAFVGAIINSTCASDFFSQDMEDLADDDAQPGRAKVTIPKATGAASSDRSGPSGDMCCGKKMMVSQFDKTQLYCTKCKAKKPVESQAAPVVKVAPAATPKVQVNAEQTKPMGRIELGTAINQAARKLGVNIQEYCHALFGKPTKDLSVDEMNHLLATLNRDLEEKSA